MISYNKLWNTMRARGVSQYRLVNDFGISKGTLDRLRHDRPVSTETLNTLCQILNCQIHDIIEYTDE